MNSLDAGMIGVKSEPKRWKRIRRKKRIIATYVTPCSTGFLNSNQALLSRRLVTIGLGISKGMELDTAGFVIIATAIISRNERGWGNWFVLGAGEIEPIGR